MIFIYSRFKISVTSDAKLRLYLRIIFVARVNFGVEGRILKKKAWIQE